MAVCARVSGAGTATPRDRRDCPGRSRHRWCVRTTGLPHASGRGCDIGRLVCRADRVFLSHYGSDLNDVSPVPAGVFGLSSGSTRRRASSGWWPIAISQDLSRGSPRDKGPRGLHRRGRAAASRRPRCRRCRSGRRLGRRRELLPKRYRNTPARTAMHACCSRHPARRIEHLCRSGRRRAPIAVGESRRRRGVDAAGCPDSTTNVGGFPDFIIEGVTGRMVPPRDPARLAAAMQDLLENRSRAAAMASQGKGMPAPCSTSGDRR